MPIYQDQTGREVEIPNQPQRIISIVPSQTELLFDLGLEDEVIGITKFCVHPDEWFRTKTRVGGTKSLDIKKIKELKPDLIIANKEENTKEEVEELAQEFPVWISDIQNLPQALDMIRSVGIITGKKPESHTMVNNIQATFDGIEHLRSSDVKPKTCYLIWKAPFMSAGGDSFINEMMEYAGLDNICKTLSRYPEINLNEIGSACDLVLLSSEPYPFSKKHFPEIRLAIPGVKVTVADGEMFSWYGSRLLKAPAYFLELHNQINALP